MNINGTMYLVVGLPYLTIGDLLAIWSLCGFVLSANNSTPCTICKTLSNNFVTLNRNPSLYGGDRTTDDLLKVLMGSNRGAYGKIITHSVKESMCSSGVERLTAMLLWKGFDLSRLPIDMYHQIYLGFLDDFLTHVFTELGIRDFGELETHWNKYVKLNKLEVTSTLGTTKEKKKKHQKGVALPSLLRHFAADGKKKFLEWLPLSLFHMNIDLSTESKSRAFKALIILSKISKLLSLLSFSNREVQALETYLQSLSVYWENDVPGYFKGVNMHNLLRHMVDQIKRFGPSRGFGVMPYERRLRPIKAELAKTNNKQVTRTVFNRHFTKVLYELLNLFQKKTTLPDETKARSFF
jgi:hypothetical protein